jgi:hypothetical protein
LHPVPGVTIASPPATVYLYDAAGKLTQAIDRSGKVTLVNSGRESGHGSAAKERPPEEPE